MIALLMIGCALLDPDDCRVAGEGHCEVYRPAGLLCGLVHQGLDGHPGSGCGGMDPAGVPVDDLSNGCPRDFQHVMVSEHESDAMWHTCIAVGNPEQSSASRAEVARGAACGFNTSGGGGTANGCEGANSNEGECPTGYTLRYSLDVYADSPEEGGAPELGGHLDTWCELTDGGCAWEECQDPIDVVCGLHASAPLHRVTASTIGMILADEELHPALRAALEADLADGDVEQPTCQGAEPGACPEGLALACTGEWLGSTGVIEPASLCWCTRPEAVRPAVE